MPQRPFSPLVKLVQDETIYKTVKTKPRLTRVRYVSFNLKVGKLKAILRTPAAMLLHRIPHQGEIDRYMQVNPDA